MWLLVPIRPKVARCIMKFRVDGIDAGDSRRPLPRTLHFLPKTACVLTSMKGGRMIVVRGGAVCLVPVIVTPSSAVDQPRLHLGFECLVTWVAVSGKEDSPAGLSAAGRAAARRVPCAGC